jgi:hypothetical protein
MRLGPAVAAGQITGLSRFPNDHKRSFITADGRLANNMLHLTPPDMSHQNILTLS